VPTKSGRGQAKVSEHFSPPLFPTAGLCTRLKPGTVCCCYRLVCFWPHGFWC